MCVLSLTRSLPHTAPLHHKLTQAGGNIELASSSGTRPLHYAVQYGQSKAVQWMLQEGCDVDGANSMGWGPLHFSARYGRKDICEMLLAQVAPPPSLRLPADTPRPPQAFQLWLRCRVFRKQLEGMLVFEDPTAGPALKGLS